MRSTWRSHSTLKVRHADKLGLTKHFINFYRALVIQVAKRNSGLTCNNKWKLWNQFLWHLTQQCFQQWQFWMFIFNFLMKGNGVRMMLLFVRWCDSEWISKLGSQTDKWAALTRSEESKKILKSCKHQPHPQLTLEPSFFRTQELRLYCSLSNWGT